MKIALYKGKSPISRAIRFITRSDYSHAAFLFDEETECACTKLRRAKTNFGKLNFHHAGAVFEAWQGGVRNTHGLGAQHDVGTPVDIFSFIHPLHDFEEQDLILSLIPEIGTPYNWRDVFRFITRKPGNLDDTWFCSELVLEKLTKIGRPLFARTKSWEAPPGLIARTQQLKLDRTIIT